MKLRSNRGVTLTSLVIYIVGLVIVIALMGNFTGYFYKNIKDVTISQSAEEQFSKFLSYITKDANSDNLIYVQSGANDKDCVVFKFKDGTEHQYIIQDQSIYYINVDDQNDKKILLCEKVSVSTVKAFSYNDKKIDINFNIGDANFSKTLSVKM